MAKVMKEVEVSKEMVEVYEGVAALVDAAKAAKDAGLSGAALLAAVAAAGLQPVVTAIDGLPALGAEASEELPEFVAAHGVGAALVGKAVAKLLKK